MLGAAMKALVYQVTIIEINNTQQLALQGPRKHAERHQRTLWSVRVTEPVPLPDEGGQAFTRADQLQLERPETEDSNTLQQGSAAQTETGKASASGTTKFATKGTDIHTLCTSNGSPYLNFQTRIMYAPPAVVGGACQSTLSLLLPL